VVIESCALCSKSLWKKDIICLECREVIARFPLFYRKQGSLTIFSLFIYRDEAAQIILRLKNGKEKQLSQILTEILIQKIPVDIFENVIGVIPVPAKNVLDKDHAFVIAEAISAKLGVDLRNDFAVSLVTQSQKSKKLQGRKEVEFRLLGSDLPSKKGVWILTDDVITTGMSLLELHKTLESPPAVCLTLASRPYYD
jgi:predicted amidophosphoribosyltransferase